jgi:KipI family sensor histidine kinase inhibitor
MIRRAGDHAALVELADNAAALAYARALEGADVVDVVVGHRTVLVVWEHEPPALDIEVVGAPAPAGRLHELEVVYEGEDLDEVAALTGLSPAEVVACHCAPEYGVGFVGFQPGFAYLLGLDPRLLVPRRDTPRTRVPGGSVAIAGPYSGVYPRESPGGWRLLGRTGTVLFDPDRSTRPLLAPGDRVRFVAA